MWTATVSLGDVCVALVAFCSAMGAFYGVKSHITSINYKVEELRRGRGLILQDWPYTVQRCFGWRAGGKTSGD